MKGHLAVLVYCIMYWHGKYSTKLIKSTNVIIFKNVGW